ncbi:MAG TPA: flagellar basal body-associated FliL family protein [Rhodanobacter sp.]|nr:flagellar basal body-associated FliL family protein [Rhodanobacter sp.]
MAKPDQDDAVATPDAPRKRGPLLVVVILLLLAVGGGGYWMSVRHHGAATADKAEASAVAKEAIYAPLEPAFVVNLRDGDALRYLQVGITLRAHDAKAVDAVKQADPVIRDALLSLFGSQNFAAMSDPAARTSLQAKALAAVQKIIKERTGSNGVDALYFTSFVIQ